MGEMTLIERVARELCKADTIDWDRDCDEDMHEKRRWDYNKKGYCREARRIVKMCQEGER